jgi:LacI family transcriptional regulator
MDEDRERRIALLVVPREPTLRGIGKYVWPDKPWVFDISHPSAAALEQLTERPPDGLLAYLSKPELDRQAARIGCPVVNISGALAKVGTARVTCDSIAAGRMAANYFLGRGFRRFAYVGDGRTAFSAERRKGYAARLREAGYDCISVDWGSSSYPTTLEHSREDDERIGEWLLGLPRGTAVFAVNDRLGCRLGELATRRAIRIPDRIAVLGMDDMGMSMLGRTHLSSIPYPAERIAYEAAAALDRLMAGAPTVGDVRIPPESVVTRHSTDVLAVTDPQVAKAVRFIRDRLAERIRVPDVARASGLNRRTLEKRFAAILGHSPGEEIRRARVEAARRMLLATDLSIDDIAEECGFSGRRWLSSVFVSVTGLTPARYRRERKLPAG